MQVILMERVLNLGKPIVTRTDIKKLEAIEIEEASKRGLEEFKYDNNEEMLNVMGLLSKA